MSNKKMTIRKKLSRKRSSQRRHSLKNNPPVKGKLTTLEEQNRDVINSLLAKVSK